ncbi:MAG: antibiotic biosynthesis monooxygenase [Hyphomonadaceae bacterium]
MFIAVTKMQFPVEIEAKVREIAAASDPIFRRQAGFVSMRAFRAEDGASRMTMIEWRSKADHERCMTSPDFAGLNQSWGALFAQGATFEMWTGESES